MAIARNMVDARDLKELERVLSMIPAEAQNDVRKTNRTFAAKLRDYIRAIAPRSGGEVQHRAPDSKESGNSRKGGNTRTGAWRASVKSFAYTSAAGVRGGDTTRAPHFIANEFGGSVVWRSRTGKKHPIPVRSRSPQVISKSGRSVPGGWFFFPTALRHIDELVEEHADAMHALTERYFHSI